MKKLFIPLILIFTILISSCLLDARGRLLKRERKRVDKGEITQAQYDSTLYSMYTINDSNYRTDSTLLFYNGVYIIKEHKYESLTFRYQVLKLDKYGNAFMSFYVDTITQKNIDSIYKARHKYTVKEGQLIIEKLAHDNSFNLVNMFGQARISGDSLIFYKHYNLGDLYHKPITPYMIYLHSDSIDYNIDKN